MNSSKEPVTLTNKFPAAHPGASNEITDYEQERIFFESGPFLFIWRKIPNRRIFRR